jgi:hypothetical protein
MIVKCAFCLKNIYRAPHRILSYRNHFCSKKCLDASLTKEKIKTYCLTCGKEIEYLESREKWGGRKFCSKECFNKRKLKGTFFKCLICEKEFYLSPRRIKDGGGKCCSASCRIKSQTGPFGSRTKTGHSVFKRYSASLKSKTCSICNSTHRVDLHHKDGNKLNNKSESNWILLCRSCHMRIHSISKKCDISLLHSFNIFVSNNLHTIEENIFKYYIPTDEELSRVPD